MRPPRYGRREQGSVCFLFLAVHFDIRGQRAEDMRQQGNGVQPSKETKGMLAVGCPLCLYACSLAAATAAEAAAVQASNAAF